MCLIISRRAGVKPLDKSVYEEGFRANPDGAGMSYVEGGQLVVEKGWMAFDKFYEDLLKLGDREVLIHFRNASADMVIDVANCHPFEAFSGGGFVIGEGEAARPRYEFAIVHNGKLEWRHTKTKSDTHCFVDDLLAPHFERDPFFLDSYTGELMLTRTIGTTNKVVVMRYDVKEDKLSTYIINPKGGYGDKEAHEKWGCWFSNSSYLKVVHPYHQGRTEMGDWYREQDEIERGNAAPTYRSFWETPDKDGWGWSFTKHSWVNAKTGVEMEKLVSRPQRPAYMYTRRKVAPVLVEDDDAELKHLVKHDRKRLRKMAADYATDRMGKSLTMSNQEVLFLFRADVRLAFSDEVGGLGSAELDKWIMDKDFSSKNDWLLDKQAAREYAGDGS